MNHVQRKPPRRRTSQQRQEQLSRAQFRAVLADWVCQDPTEDLGEDFLVSIYDDGVSTGLSFHVQLKSVADLSTKAPTSASNIHYSLDVKDLLHWEDASPPVVLIVWDVEKSDGYWRDIPSILDELDTLDRKKGTKAPSVEQRASGWRSQKTKTVSIPIECTLDESGRQALRRRLAHLALPVLARGKTLSVTPRFVFPNTEPGRAARQALFRAIEEGESITINRPNIAAFRASRWFERAFGSEVPDSITIRPSASTAQMAISLEAVVNEEYERTSVILRRTKAGTKLAIFETVDPQAPAKLSLSIDERADKVTFAMSCSFPHPDVEACLWLAKALRIVQMGGHLRALIDGQLVGDFELTKEGLPSVPVLEWWIRILARLAIVQGRTSRYGRFAVRANLEPSVEEKVGQLHRICTSGTDEATMSFRLELKAPPEMPHSDATDGPSVWEIAPFGDIKLLGVTIPMGRVEITIADGKVVADAFREAAAANRKTVVLKDVQVTRRYLDWIAPNSGPAQTAAQLAQKKPRRARSAKNGKARRRPKGSSKASAAKSSHRDR